MRSGLLINVSACSASRQERVKVMLGRHQSSERDVEVPMDALEDEVARHLGVYGQYVGDTHWSKAVKKLLELAGALPKQDRGLWVIPCQLA
jgi:hypothetical protein